LHGILLYGIIRQHVLLAGSEDEQVIVTFRDRGTEDVFNGESTKVARRTCPSALWGVARRKLDMINSAAQLSDLKVPPKNRLKKLTNDRTGQHSIRINDQYRVCFIWGEQGAEEVEITDYHS
jgi:proteic killer suppression protein